MKINDNVTFKAGSLKDRKIVELPNEDTNLYTIRLENGGTIRCTEHYFTVISNG